MPRIDQRAVLIGGAIAVATTVAGVVIGSLAGLPAIGTFAPLPGIAAGAFVAGRLARQAGLLHGGMVAVLWIAIDAISSLFGAPPPGDIASDTVLILLRDVIHLAVGSAAGILGGRDLSR